VGAPPAIGYASVLRRTRPMLPEWTGTGANAAPANMDAAATPMPTNATDAALAAQLRSRIALMVHAQQRLTNARQQADDLQRLLSQSRMEQLSLEAEFLDHMNVVVELQARVLQDMEHRGRIIAANSGPTVQWTRNQMQEYIDLQEGLHRWRERMLEGRMLEAQVAAAQGTADARATMPDATASIPAEDDNNYEL
jgi:hypothetical protein